MCERCDEINGVLGQTLAHLDDEREGYEREREVLALVVVEMTRHTQAMIAILERAKSRLAGITPKGRSPKE